jgi:uncharacterized membrane protein
VKNTRTSLLGLIASGFLIVLPLLLLGLAIGKLHRLLAGWARPLLDAMPGTIFRNPNVRSLAVLLAIAALFLLIGVMARTRLGRSAGRWVELALLSRLPFYNVLRTLTAGLAGQDDAATLKPVLVEMSPGIHQIGLVIERHTDGRSTVFLPEAPNPGSGNVVFVDPSLLSEIRIPVHKVLQCYARWGHGTAAALETAKGRGMKSNSEA